MPLLWWKWIAGLALVLALIAAIAVQTSRLSGERAAHAQTRERFAAAQLAAERAAAAHLKQQQEAADLARASLDEARRAIDEKDRATAAARADVRGLRQQLAAYAAARNLPGAACAADDGRTVAVASLAAEGFELLDEGADLLRACARAHDERSAEVAALLKAWPR